MVEIVALLVIAAALWLIVWLGGDAKDPQAAARARVLTRVSRELAVRDDARRRRPSHTVSADPRRPLYDIEYVDQDGVITDRRIGVIGYYSEEGAAYIVAYCFLRENQRTFRVDRISKMIDATTGQQVLDVAWTARRFRRYRRP